MAEPQEFKHIESEISGRNLIEASAGTGKTYTITGLYLRLLLEENLEVDEILVVTFTEAATNELKERIRATLLRAKEDFLARRSDDKFLSGYIKKNQNSEKAGDTLDKAIRNFDEAAIYTIHGFCNRVLQEHAFESGGLFDTELVTEQTELLRQVVEDFWRKHLYEESRLFVSYAVNKMSPEALSELLGDKVGLLYLEIIPKATASDCSSQERHFHDSFRRVRDMWPMCREKVESILCDNPGLNRNQYKQSKVPTWIKAMDLYTASESANPMLFPGFEKFSTTAITQGTKKNHLPPTHPFFDQCEDHVQNHLELEQVYNERLIALKRELFDYARDELKKRKEEKNVFFFDDLLLNLHAALTHEGEKLAAPVRTKFKAALIDEFQDTDPVQYEIFKKIFDHDDSILFLIGDPKQAIYGFRGADVFAYMRAKSEVPTQYTLSKNYRSDPKLISSINTVFEGANNPFIYHEIPFHKASAPEKLERGHLRIAGGSDAPFRLWLVDASKHAESGKALTKPQARDLIVEAVASEVVRVLKLGQDRKALLGERPLEERDMAVLVRTNSEARQMQEALLSVNVHSVLYSSANLFESEEAREFQRVLTAVVEPKNQKFLKAALATEIIGVTGEELFRFTEDELALEAWFDKFANYHRLWLDHGFMRMFKDLLYRENLLTRLMAYPDGERRITNILHLAEVLHQAAVEQKLGMTGLLKWLSEQRMTNVAPVEAHQLRLESDENAVKLVTMHMSKGLEYPVVFCPFTWSGSFIRNPDTLKFHDEANDRAFTLDLGSESMDEHKVFAQKEELAENLRLLYVAVTRAKHRCYLVWGRFNEAETSAPAYLFHQPKILNTEDVVGSIKEHFKTLDDAQIRNKLRQVEADSGGVVELAELPKPEGVSYQTSHVAEEKLTCRDFSAKIDASERISSYSSLIARLPHGEEQADYDALLAQDTTEVVPEEAKDLETYSDILAFPRGAKTGIFMHHLFQNLDFTESSSTGLEEFIGTKLQEFGFEAEWLPAVRNMVDKVLTVPLGLRGRSFSLSQISRKDRLNELEFYFPLKTISPGVLKSIFAQYAGVELAADFPTRIERLNFVRFKGFMKGFIDLVLQKDGRYYIVDWKSNYFGNELKKYDQKALAQAMAEHYYILQYHLYVVALNQYLKVRLPNYRYQGHFGGVFYIFLRGVDPSLDSGYGVYRARPSEGMIEELSGKLLAQQE